MALSVESSQQTFTTRFSASAAMTARTATLIPGGYSRNSFNFGPHAVFVESGRGQYLETIDGHRLLDLNNNYTVNVLGHDHPAVTAALMNAIPDGVSFGNPTRAEAELAALLIDRIPSVEMIQFSCSATESCMGAIRVARAYTGRQKYAKFEGGYHGFSDGLHVSSHTEADADGGPDTDPRALPDSGGIPDADIANVIVLVQNDREGTERILRQHAAELACLIVELQSGAGGLVPLDQHFVEMLRELTTELGILLVFDETISLRAGLHGLQGDFGVTPDLTVMGKMIGGGLPLGALGGSAEVMRLLEDGTVSISGTHHGHKLALIAGAACMTAMDEAAFARLNDNAARIMSEVNDWSRSRNSRFGIYGRGFSHLAYGFMVEPGLTVRNHRDYWRKVDGPRTHIVSLELASRGFYPVHRGEFSLSLPMTDDDITAFIETLRTIATEIEG